MSKKSHNIKDSLIKYKSLIEFALKNKYSIKIKYTDEINYDNNDVLLRDDGRLVCCCKMQ